MQEFTIQRSSRKCHKGERPFEPGERYYSVVLERGSELVRQDFSKEHWHGPPEKTVGWWVSQMPAKRTGKLTLAPTLVLLDALEKLCEQPEDGDLAYLLAVLLIRRRLLTELPNDGSDDEPSHLQLIYPTNGREFLVPAQTPTSDRVTFLHQKLIDLLYCET
ncbi:MAG: hypothetical protein NTY15_19015 [Planctomycetota bacterium]|nr:hypothetical protein [Planctomycetota bacterium]